MPRRVTATNLSAAPGELSGTLPAEFGAANSHSEYAQQPEGFVSCGNGKVSSQPATCMTTPTGKGHGPLIDSHQYSLHREAVRDQAANARHQTHAQYDRYVVGLQREHQRTLAQRALSPLVTSPLKPHQAPAFSTSPPLPTAVNAPYHSPPPHAADSFSWSAESESYSPAPRGPLFPPRGDNRPSGSPAGPTGHFHREEDGGDLPLHSIAWEVSVYSSPNVMSPLSSAGSGVWVRVEPSDNRRPAAETLTAARQLMANNVLPAQSCHAPAQQPPLFPPPHVDGLSKNEFISLVSQYF